MAELTPLQKKTLEAFARSPLAKHFYWSGGTALAAVYLHHRISHDLDFFSDETAAVEPIHDFVRELKANIPLEFVEERKIYDRRNFFLHNKEELRLEFVHYNHPRLGKRKQWQSIMVDSLDDLAANKCMALFDRNEPKDALDIYFILTQAKYEPAKILQLAEKKFGLRLDEGSLWSEALKSAKSLGALRPLLPGGVREQKALLAEINTYFETQSKQFLTRMLK